MMKKASIQFKPTSRFFATAAVEVLPIATLCCVVLLATTFIAMAQPVTLSTLAGYAGRGGHDGVGSEARFYHPHGLAMDAAGNIYVADSDNHIIRKITAAGVVTTVAGLAGSSGSVDDTASNARFNKPEGVAVDSAGYIYVSDTGNHTVRRIAPGGAVSTIAGAAGVSGYESGYGADARFNQPLSVAVDSNDNVYVADFGNGAVRIITVDGAVGTMAVVPGPQGLAVDAADNLYATDYASSTVLKITAPGNVITLAGAANNPGGNDGTGTNAAFYHPAAVTVDAQGRIYVADWLNSTIREITPAGVVTTLAGSVGTTGSNDGVSTNALFFRPQGIVVDSTFNVYVADTENSTIRKISAAGMVTTFAGSPSSAFADAARGGARFAEPAGVAADTAGNLFVADARNSVIRKVTPAGVVSTFAGSAGQFGSVDATGTSAQFFAPEAIAVDPAGNVYVADMRNSTIRGITAGGAVSTLAGSAGYNGYFDGIGTNAEFFQPQGIALDPSGDVIISDTLNHVLRKISGGVVTTIAGLGENFGSADGTNSNARFNRPAGIAVDAAGTIYVADCFNHTIRRVTVAGTNRVATTIAGFAGLSGSADGTNNNARFFQPRGIAVDATSNVYVVDAGNHSLRKITPLGTNWIVTTVAGWSGVGGSLDGAGTSARFDNPVGIGIDGAGFLYIADAGNNTLRINRILPPQLQIAWSANAVVLSWSALASEFVLEKAVAVPSASWTEVSGLQVLGDSYVVTNSVTPGAGFYRLRLP